MECKFVKTMGKIHNANKFHSFLDKYYSKKSGQYNQTPALFGIQIEHLFTETSRLFLTCNIMNTFLPLIIDLVDFSLIYFETYFSIKE